MGYAYIGNKREERAWMEGREIIMEKAWEREARWSENTIVGRRVSRRRKREIGGERERKGRRREAC